MKDGAMKNFNQYLVSSTSSIAPFTCSDTNIYPFIKYSTYKIDVINLNQVIIKNYNDSDKNEQITSKKTPKPGFLKGTFVMKDDFDEPLEEFLDYM